MNTNRRSFLATILAAFGIGVLKKAAPAIQPNPLATRRGSQLMGMLSRLKNTDHDQTYNWFERDQPPSEGYDENGYPLRFKLPGHLDRVVEEIERKRKA